MRWGLISVLILAVFETGLRKLAGASFLVLGVTRRRLLLDGRVRKGPGDVLAGVDAVLLLLQNLNFLLIAGNLTIVIHSHLGLLDLLWLDQPKGAVGGRVQVGVGDVI